SAATQKRLRRDDPLPGPARAADRARPHPRRLPPVLPASDTRPARRRPHPNLTKYYYLVAEEFQFARHYSPVSTGLRLLPFFGMPMIISPLAGALSDKTGRRPVMVTGLALLTAGFTWVAVRGSLATSWVELTLALLVSGI